MRTLFDYDNENRGPTIGEVTHSGRTRRVRGFKNLTLRRLLRYIRLGYEDIYLLWRGSWNPIALLDTTNKTQRGQPR